MKQDYKLFLKGKFSIASVDIFCLSIGQVVRDKSRLDNTDVYILDLGLTIYQWNGQGCNKDERFQVYI